MFFTRIICIKSLTVVTVQTHIRTHTNKTDNLMAITYSHMEGEHETSDKHENSTDGQKHRYN